MPSPQPKNRAMKIAIVFLRKSRSIGKRLHDGVLQVRIGAHSKLSNSASASSDTQRTTSVSPTAQLPTENHHQSHMSPNDLGDDQHVQVDHYENLPLPPPPPLHDIPQGPPPPPMPVSHPCHPPGGKKAYNFAEIDMQYNELMEAREDLMGERFRISRERKKINKLHEQIGSNEGSALNQLRNFLSKQSVVIPREIEEMLEQIEALRDQLGPMEADYQDAERSYTRKEVEVAGQQSDLIDRLGDVHLHYSAQFDFQPTLANGNALERSLAAAPEHPELVPQDENIDLTAPNKALQLVVQTNVNYDVQEQVQTQDIDGTYTAGIELYANREDVQNWLCDMIFQSPLQQIQRQNARQASEADQSFLPDKVPDNWFLIDSFGAQFYSTDLKHSDETAKKRYFTISRPRYISRKNSSHIPRLIHTKGRKKYAKRSFYKHSVDQTMPIRGSKSTGDMTLTNDQETFSTVEIEHLQPCRIHQLYSRGSLNCPSIAAEQLSLSHESQNVRAI